MYDAPARISAVFSFVAISLVGAAVRADQVVVADVTYTHSNDTTQDSHYRIAPAMGGPADWSGPVDFTKGSVHVVLEVKTKPGNAPTKFQICFEGEPTYACTDQSPEYTATGKQEWNSPFSRFWVPEGTTMNWKNGIDKIALILKDNQNKTRTEATYQPTDLRVEVTLLSQGATYMPTGGGNQQAAGAAAPRAGSAAPAGRGGTAAAGSGGRSAGAEAGAASSGNAGAGSPDMAGASEPASTTPANPGSTGLAGSRGSAGARAAGAGGSRSSTSAGGSGGSDDGVDQDFQYPSGNESGCSVSGAGAPAGHPPLAALLLSGLGMLFGARRRKRA